MPDHSTDVAIIVDVDAHKDIHVAVAIDTLGRRQSGSPGMSVGEVEPGGQRRSWWRGGFGDTASELGDAHGSRF